MTHELAYLGVAAVVIATPGPDTVLTLRNVVRAGKPAGSATAAGVAAGQLVWATAAALGLAGVLGWSAIAYRAVRLVGALYLLLLAAAATRRAVRGEKDPAWPETKLRIDALAAFRQGLASNLANPKMVAFFTGLLPQFAPSGAEQFPAMLAMGAMFAGMTLLWLNGYSLMAVQALQWLRLDRVQRIMDAACAVVFAGLGARLLSDASH